MNEFHRVNRIKTSFSKELTPSKRRSPVCSVLRGLEVLERRELLATFMVTNLGDSGAGSLRQAILASNARAGADTIDFSVAGTIRIGRTSLPFISDTVTIDGSSSPTFVGSPVVTVDFQGSNGLQFNPGADGSTLRSLALVSAGDAGITLTASRVTVQGNDIGLRSDGNTVAGNLGDGIRINAASHDNLIGRSNPVTSISYANALNVSPLPVSVWQGIRGADTPGQYLISGTSSSNGLFFVGTINGQGTSYSVNYPGAASTSVYGPDNLAGDQVRLVGSYKNGEDVVHGFVFEGTTTDLSTSGNYRTIDYPGAKFNYVHSTMGGLAVGNYDGPTANGQPLGVGHAYIYDVAKGTFLTDLVFPGSVSNTAYGIWDNGKGNYTICGGYSNLPLNNLNDQRRPIGQAYLVDYDAATGRFTNWKSFNDPNGLVGHDYVTHFEGISSVEKGVYTLSADSLQTGSTNPAQGSWVSVRRNPNGTFGDGVWVDLNYPDSTGITSSNAVYGNQVVGVVFSPAGAIAYESTVNIGFQLSNVISGNGGNGIGIYGSSGNQIAMNEIGTDITGTLIRGNAKNGILVTNGAARNFIGGQATGGNDPTSSVFVRPPQGNLISGNQGNGVLINKGATQTLLSGNFVGTSGSGNSALGNRLDGVAIENANGNQLIGCTYQQSPFVFYNVLSGNGGNGLRITNANNTTVQANFIGVGANNGTVVANGGDGLLVSGASKNIQVGGVIPLGNVISGNTRNGIEVRDSASGFISFNTFAGIFAFLGAAPNQLDGILITSTGGNNLIRTCIVSGNLGNGIEIGGDATGVQVTDTAIGTNTNIQTAIPNQGSGILISGRAHGNFIGGVQPSVEPQVTVSSNRRYGIAIVGSAHNNRVAHTYLGTNSSGTAALGNVLGGIYLGPGTASNTIGGSSAALQNKILNSGGNGVTIQSSSGNEVIGNDVENNAKAGVVVTGGLNNLIGSATAGNTIAGNGLSGLYVSGSVPGTRIFGNQIRHNTGNGVTLQRAKNLTVGSRSGRAGNWILNNQGYGLYASGLSNGTVVQENRIGANALGNVNLTDSRGIVYIPRRAIGV